MADNRIHPGNTSDRYYYDDRTTIPLQEPFSPPAAAAPGTYTIQIRKDRTFGPPPPRRHPLHKQHQQQPKRKRCSCCTCCFIWIFIVLILLLLAATAALYILIDRNPPNYSIDAISVQRLNLTTSASSVYSPTFNVTVRASNPYDKIGMYHGKASSVSISHSGINLGRGLLSAFYQPPNNVTLLHPTLRGSALRFSATEYKTLIDQQRNREVPLRLDMKMPVKFEMISIKTWWSITIKVKCDITIDRLTKDASVVHSNCDTSSIMTWR